MANVSVTIVSKNAEFKMPADMFKTFEASNPDIKISYISEYANNTKSLTQIYNEDLQRDRSKGDVDFHVFMHADVSFNLSSFFANLLRCQYRYDVFGLCGTSVMNISQSPLNWFTSSNPTPGARWGCVTHGELGNQTSFFSQHTPDANDHEVACIDGLCIVFGPRAMKSDLNFDETFAFDQYDTDISLQAVLKYKFKIGVLVEKSLQHYSIGKSIMTEEFLKHELDLRKKWGFDIPAGTKLAEIAASQHTV